MTTFAIVTDPRFILIVANYYKGTVTRKEVIATYKHVCGNEANINKDFLEYLYQQTERASTSLSSSASMFYGIYDADGFFSELWEGDETNLPAIDQTYSYISAVISNVEKLVKSI